MKVTVTDSFWLRYRDLVRREMLPFQWRVLNDEGSFNVERERADDSIPAGKSHAVANFRIAAGLEEGEHFGWVFQDSDVYKWLEAAAYSLAEKEDAELLSRTEMIVDLIGKAQQPDGYVNTYYTCKGLQNRYTRLSESHELYCAGHYFEAAAALYWATGNKQALEIAVKWANHLCTVFGPEEGKIHGYDGHEEVKIGLMRLYDLTGRKDYLKLAAYFLEIRGDQDIPDHNFMRKQYEQYPDAPNPISNNRAADLRYFQADTKVREMQDAHGHAVRVVYLCNALTRIALETGDEELKETARRLWKNITGKQMYVTGAIGSTVIGESFTFDYNLPNDSMYGETCASVGLVFFAKQMLRMEAKGEYGDVMERALYNTCLAGMALDGKHFFYVNPLEANPESYRKDPTKSHVKCLRPEWLGCACCPPNLARLLASLDDYIYVQNGKDILSVLFIGSRAVMEMGDAKVMVEQETDYPRTGEITYRISVEGDPENARFGIRIPAWTESVNVNGMPVTPENGFAYVPLKEGLQILKVSFPLEVLRVHAHTKIRANAGKTALQRGPFVYCLEGVDNGVMLQLLSLKQGVPTEEQYSEELLGGVTVLTASGYRREEDPEDAPLYSYNGKVGRKVPVSLTFIPYYAWANRGENEMQVWISEEE